MWLLVALLIALGTGMAHAEVPVQTCLHKLDPGVSEADVLGLSDAQFDCKSRQTTHGPGNFAVQLRFAPVRSDADDPLVLHNSSPWQQGAVIHYRYADGSTARLAFESSAISPYTMIGAQFAFPVPARAAPLTGIVVEVRGSANWRGVLQGARLMTRSECDVMDAWLIALYAGFGGLSLALLVYNLALWSVLGHRFQLVYCAMVTTLMGYAFTSSGAVLLAFPELGKNDRIRINYLLLALAAIFAVRFTHEFFGDRVIGPLQRRIADRLSLATLMIAGGFCLLAPWPGWILERAYNLVVVTLVLLLFPALWSAWRVRSRYVGLFALAWTAPVVISLVRALHGFGLLPYNFWLDNGNLIALSIESLLSTFLIVTRLRELSQDRDIARAGEQSALRLAATDPLTGLLNRRAFLEEAIGRAGGYRLMLIDIDHFKGINDRLGHEGGDQVLRAIAEVIQACRPRGSLAVRLGGEEFAVLLPLRRQNDYTPESLIVAVRSKAMPLCQKVTVSLGFADGNVASEEDWKRLYRLADTALYRAKADGRDRACRATDFKLAQAVRG